MITTIADHDQADVYLETTGDGNIGFYTKKGDFEEKERRTITDEATEETFSQGGGMTFMVRKPKTYSVLGEPNK